MHTQYRSVSKSKFKWGRIVLHLLLDTVKFNRILKEEKVEEKEVKLRKICVHAVLLTCHMRPKQFFQ